MLDADGSTDPAEIPRFVAALCNGADFVKGSRFAQGGGSTDITPIRRLGNRVLNAFVNALYGTHYTDLCYGYNAFWARCLPYMPSTATGFEVETLINVRIAKAGLVVHEVPSYEHPRLREQQPPCRARRLARPADDCARADVDGIATIAPPAHRLPPPRRMRVAIVASSFLPEPGRLERRVDKLARGLASSGAEVEILTQGPVRSTLHLCERVTVRRFPKGFAPCASPWRRSYGSGFG